MLRFIPLLLALVSLVANARSAPEWISGSPQTNGFQLSHPKGVAIHFHPDDAAVVRLASETLAEDLQAVTGAPSQAISARGPGKTARPPIFVGVLGQSPLIDALRPRLPGDTLARLEGAWESFLIAPFAYPDAPGGIALAIVGSDRRGAAFGAFELSEAIGVSPWNWWADVPIPQATSLWITSGAKRFGPPSVKYRGIFINDEDWGLHPWARYTYDPDLGDIGPKTYQRVFELLLRLKANTLWPAMHEVTRAFNLYPENKRLADRYAIVMASSHAEPMLRNNVTEWTYPKSHFNYNTHRDLVLDYWEQRLQENGSFENIYTIGMRGIHDSGMTGAATMDEKIATLSRIFEDQRALLRKHVDPDLSQAPQAFTPYKEVLDIYRAGLEVPDDVTLVWPDDNHGYIRYLPTAREQGRPGGSGVYYHFSYLGSPLSYLWLNTTPPALVWQEMDKAYALGARQLWIANVGDIKPAELSIDLFLRMAWDRDAFPLGSVPNLLPDWAERVFGPAHAQRIGDLMQRYFALNYQRRPEHLQWWLPHSRVQPSPFTGPETRARLTAFAELVAATNRIQKSLQPEQLDAYFQLVAYPIKASAYANFRYFHNEQYDRQFNAAPDQAAEHAARARFADQRIDQLTLRYNQGVADGKWKRFMAEEPADGMWRSYRLSPLPLPQPNLGHDAPTAPLELSHLRFEPQSAERPGHALIAIEAEDFQRSVAREGLAWQRIPGLGLSGDSVATYPVDAPPTDADAAPTLEYDFRVDQSGDYRIALNLVPTFPILGQDALRIAVSLDDSPPRRLELSREPNSPLWKESVLSARLTLRSDTLYPLERGQHVLRLHRVDSGVLVDQLFLIKGDGAPGYLGPMPD